ncbi:MAG: acetyl-CoA C-acyltransferase [Coxiella sp. (in: Bacteria)]|nr:MAG: acetyl-CoA C-acyltransferase [Coxiella sp. (in: g-proteobacteria)]
MKPVYIVDGTRTPFLKAPRTGPGAFSASDLAVAAGRELLSRIAIDPTVIGETIFGCMMPSEDEANIGRLIGLRLGCGDSVPGWTVQRNCASGIQSLDSAMKDIQTGRHELVLAGGTETMSRAPLIYRPEMVRWFAAMNAARSIPDKLGTLVRLKPKYLFAPIIALIKGLTDPIYGINMGQTAEILAHDFNISREEMDAYAAQSQHRALAAYRDGHFKDEVMTLYDSKGNFYSEDNGIREDTSEERLAKLKPLFDRKFGRVTAGNSSQVTDGAAVLLLASEEAIQKHKLPVLGKITDVHWAALDPRLMGLGPVMASTPLLKKHNMTFDDVDQWELNEAFAAQVLACLKAWESDDFCQQHFGCSALGTLDQARLNIDGGAIAIGHPVGATGSRIVLHLLNTLKRTGGKRGIATLCIGGGQGGALLVETV